MSNKTFDDLWVEYMPRKVRGKKTEKELLRIYDKYVQPTFGNRRINKISYQMVDDFHQTMKETPYQANRVLALLRPMFRFAGALQWTTPGYNPAKEVTMFSERKRRRHVKPSEAPRIATCLYEKEVASPEACLFIWLLIFTGARPNEIKTARWCDLVDGRITLTEHKSVNKTGVDRIIELPKVALQIIERLANTEFRLDAFGELSECRILTIDHPEYIWRSIRVEAQCRDMRVYDLRHTFGTYALEKGFTLDQIGEALAHTNPKTTKIYAEMTNRSRYKLATDVSLAILEDMGVSDRYLRPNQARRATRHAFDRSPLSERKPIYNMDLLSRQPQY